MPATSIEDPARQNGCVPLKNGHASQPGRGGVVSYKKPALRHGCSGGHKRRMARRKNPRHRWATPLNEDRCKTTTRVPTRGIFGLRTRAPIWAHIPAPESADKKVRADSRPSHFCPPIPGPKNGPKKGPTLRPQKQSRGAGRRGARHGSEAPGKRRTTLTPPACRHHVLPALDCLTARRTPSLTNPR